MAFLHNDLADGRWHAMSLVEQLANIGSEVGRALRWYVKGDASQFQHALDRALELFSLTVSDPKVRKARLREVLRVREVVLDFFFGGNQYRSTPESIDGYFLPFGVAANLARRAKRAQ